MVLGAEHSLQPEVGGAVADHRAVEAAAGASIRVADDHVTDEGSDGRVFRYAGDVGVRRRQGVDGRCGSVVVNVVDLNIFNY